MAGFNFPFFFLSPFFFFFEMHLDFIVGRAPTNGWAAAGEHTHELKFPPNRKYRLASQQGGGSNSKQPAGTARGGGSL